MALSTEERERIREEEWVRASAQLDFRRRYPDRSHLTKPLAETARTLLVFVATLVAMVLFIRLFGNRGF